MVPVVLWVLPVRGDRRACGEMPDLRATPAVWAFKGCGVIQVQLDPKAIVVPPDLRVIPDRKDLWVPAENAGSRESVDLSESKGPSESRDPRERLVRRVYRATVVARDLRANRVSRDPRVKRVTRGRKVSKASKDPRATPGSRDPRVKKATRAKKASRVSKDPRATPGSRDLRVKRATRAKKVNKASRDPRVKTVKHR